MRSWWKNKYPSLNFETIHSKIKWLYSNNVYQDLKNQHLPYTFKLSRAIYIKCELENVILNFFIASTLQAVFGTFLKPDNIQKFFFFLNRDQRSEITETWYLGLNWQAGNALKGVLMILLKKFEAENNLNNIQSLKWKIDKM